MDITLIEGQTLPDVWFQAIYNLIKNGRRFIVNKGSYEGEDRIEYDYFVGHIKRPWERDADGRPLVPEIPEGISIPPPVDKEYIFSYWKKLMTVEKETGEDYTYGERLVGSPNQVDKIIDTYKEFGYRNNQMILQVGQPSDIELGDPPCLRHIDSRIQDNKLHFFPYFRSWDLWGGFPANLAGISLLQEYMAAEIGVEQGEMIVSSKGLHIYGYALELAETITHNEFKNDS